MMWTYGDRVRTVEWSTCLNEIETGLTALADMPAGIVRHGTLAALLLLVGELAQGVADESQSRAGRDQADPVAAAALVLTRRVAAALLRSWRDQFAATPIADPRAALAVLRRHAGTPALQLRTAEGFAFYSVYPEAYADAAATLRGLSGMTQVVGVRSIGTVLGAVVAETIEAESFCTVRPVGDPFARVVRASDDMLANVDGHAVVADEGPGASGSSFSAVADWLERRGFSADRIVFLPSHSGMPGKMGAPSARARWHRTHRLTTPFDERHLLTWFADLVGPAIAPLTDISGGNWRTHITVDAPCVPASERRKYLLHTASGTWKLKFAGLGRHGEAKLALARCLHDGGFAPGPLGLRYGFLIEAWHGDAVEGRPSIEHLGRYLGFRARRCPADDADGASLVTLCDMARHNARECLAINLPLSPLPDDSPRVRIDGRLHGWEWLSLPDGRLLKADALDHHAAHDLIGCQPIAWDIAGAIVEFDLSAGDATRLRQIVDHEAGVANDPRLIAMHVQCYCAFQMGLWADTAQQARYARRLSAPPCPP